MSFVVRYKKGVAVLYNWKNIAINTTQGGIINKKNQRCVWYQEGISLAYHRLVGASKFRTSSVNNRGNKEMRHPNIIEKSGGCLGNMSKRKGYQHGIC